MKNYKVSALIALCTKGYVLKDNKGNEYYGRHCYVHGTERVPFYMWFGTGQHRIKTVEAEIVERPSPIV